MYLVDGHNLIPHVPGLSLTDLDDEAALIELLAVYARVKRKRGIAVFFDKAAPLRAGARSYGSIRAHFVPASSSADEAIRRELSALGSKARNATVVSSDRTVQANARAARAGVISSEQFAAELLAAREEEAARRAAKKQGAGSQAPARSPAGGPAASLDEWYRLFNLDPSQAAEPIDPPAPKRTPPRRRKGKGGVKSG
jgi:predicted RNA-binding protein with PIN domain